MKPIDKIKAMTGTVTNSVNIAGNEYIDAKQVVEAIEDLRLQLTLAQKEIKRLKKQLQVNKE